MDAVVGAVAVDAGIVVDAVAAEVDAVAADVVGAEEEEKLLKWKEAVV